MYRVFRSDAARRIISTLPHTYGQRIGRIEQNLALHPMAGNPLRYTFFREKRVSEMRVYYLVYEDIRIVLIIGISDKKAQSAFIDWVCKSLPEFRRHLEELLRRRDESGRP